jgi:predicted metalloprotease with PDZ domain
VARTVYKLVLISIILVLPLTSALGQNPDGPMASTVSMEAPNSHYYHVLFQCNDIKGESVDFKMPSWTPGYYWIENFAKNVLNFCAKDGKGTSLEWQKTSKNTWRVQSGNAQSLTVSYDVYAFTQSVADPFLDDGRGYISPAGVFMYVDGQLRHPVTVTVIPYEKWTKVSTGLDPVKGKPNTFFAKDFDVLYDCPILVGNQQILSFDVQGIPHSVAIENPGTFDREKFVADLKKMVEAGVGVIGEIPYQHYTFIIMGEGRGGLEHRNSMAVFSSGSIYNPENPAQYRGWLSFLAHEYFHLYNVKRIRPIALGPFDYDKENYTHLLWFSEGVTVYYEYLILNRAGLMTRDDCLERLRRSIASYENIPGHLFQSATEASFDTWIQFFSRGDNARNTTISYYDKGCALGMLLDLKIRHETKNKKSLDDVMRTLYRQFYKEKQRGFTDEEFRSVCEGIAGCPLPEILDVYASTVKDIDYPKYLAYAGLEVDVAYKELPGAFLGATTQVSGGDLVITGVEWDSPAWRVGLSAQDVILAIDGVKATSQQLVEALKSKKAGEKVKILVSHRDLTRELEVVLGAKKERSFRMTPTMNPSPLQSAILSDWLKE